jgi:hypothetical protein
MLIRGMNIRTQGLGFVVGALARAMLTLMRESVIAVYREAYFGEICTAGLGRKRWSAVTPSGHSAAPHIRHRLPKWTRRSRQNSAKVSFEREVAFDDCGRPAAVESVGPLPKQADVPVISA